ncbi:ABC transporter permease [Liquorilactobacillus cacaonum]|uniref:ABC transmembrane type-1 domain-containing protein n=1 Tax=Liquorilactobacillus cacaonum DSM 21116 TaxID=1423729 RepID=A0A0R2CHL6_9LACO|nr:ABC transporter permease subunit [Liquorilactobacillus cacaonum]KRM90794.1 hypothetical protein FC80_GL000786 [Liquorilactobacillus cacaonum DSM 21116]
MNESRGLRKAIIPYIYVTPAFLLILLLIAYPIVTSIQLSFQDSTTSHFTIANYQYFLTNKIQLFNIGYTLFVSIATVLLSLILGFILALYIRFNQNKISKAVVALTVLPQFIPGLVAVYSFMMVVRNGGVLSRIALKFGIQYNPNMLYAAKGLISMNLWFNIPFATLLLLASLSSIKDASIESARDIGAKKMTLLKDIILPSTYKQIFIAGAFVFMSNVGAFTTPFLMGANNPQMLGVVLYREFNENMNYNQAAALSVILFLLCSLSAVVYIIVNMRKEKWR